MVKSTVKVAVRTRPTASFAHSELVVHPEARSIDVNVKKNPSMGVVNNMRENYTFKFDTILHNSSQDTVYNECVSEIVNNVVSGYNGSVLVYGQTGAGKTYTMSGGQGNYKTRGCIPRSIQEIFTEVQRKPQQAFTIRLSYLEIYNEALFDLLAPGGVTPEMAEELLIIDDPKGGVHVKGLTVAVANTEEEAMNLFFEGETNRAIAEHQLNNQSSRSHCILTIHVESRSRVESADRVLSSKLNLVDLAGSERVSKTHSTGAILREAMYINKSLSFLEQCVNALTDRGREHVPFRQSKLTHVLKDALGGNSKTTMIANIWGEAAQLDETISTLSFAQRMMKVRTDASLNIKQEPAIMIKRYEQEIKELKQELAMHDALSGRNRVQYHEYNEEQRHELKGKVLKYIENDEENPLEVTNVRHVTEVYRAFRNIAIDLKSQAAVARPGTQGGVGGEEVEGGEGQEGQPAGIGSLANEGGFSVGRAGDDAKPISSVKSGIDSPSKSMVNNSTLGSPTRQPKQKAKPGAFVPDKAQAFEEFKETDGAQLSDNLKENQLALKEKKSAQRNLAMTINQLKKEIDAYKVTLEEKRNQVVEADGEPIVDEEEFAVVRTIKEKKAAYRESFEELKVLKSEVEYLTKLSEQSRAKLVMEYDSWYKSVYEDGDDIGKVVTMLGQSGMDVTADGEVMDDAEKFDRMEVERVMTEDPESLAYHNAAKHVFRKSTVGAHGKTKRVKGEAGPPVV